MVVFVIYSINRDDEIEEMLGVTQNESEAQEALSFLGYGCHSYREVPEVTGHFEMIRASQARIDSLSPRVEVVKWLTDSESVAHLEAVAPTEARARELLAQRVVELTGGV